MKKLFVLGAAAAMLIGSTSCKKTYTCECTDGFTTTEREGKGSDATEACNDAANTILGIPTEVCVEKV